jgi:putative phage-type endonuclease
MKVVASLEQGSTAWLDWRRKGVGASEVNVLFGLGYRKKPVDLFKSKLGQVKDDGDNVHTRRGKATEPIARLAYERLYGWAMTPLCVIHDAHDHVRASLDGIRKDGKLIVEIKAPMTPRHLKTRDEGVPDYYVPQVQYQMLITGAPLCHFVSYTTDPAVPERDRMLVVPVHADRAYQQDLLDRVNRFWKCVVTNTPPDW